MKRGHQYLYGIVCLMAIIALYHSQGCTLILQPVESECTSASPHFTGGCFVHEDGWDSGYLYFTNLDPVCGFSGVARNLSELGPREEDNWTFLGTASSSGDAGEQRAEITATWADDGGEFSSYELEGFYRSDTEILTLRRSDSEGTVNLRKTSCIREE